MDVAVLFSGGKDSSYALHLALKQGLCVKHLVSFKPRRDDSFMFHTPCIDLTSLQAEAIGLPYVEAEVSGVKEDEVAEMQQTLAGLEIDGVVSGALASNYQRTRIESVCQQLGIKSLTPLWHKDPRELMQDIIRAGFEVLVAGVAADGLGQDWLGRRIDEKALAELNGLAKKHGIHVAGEGGEYETLVVDGPIFRNRIEIKESHTEWDGVRGKLIVDDASLGDKSSL